MTERSPSKYGPLQQLLATAAGETVTLTFTELEARLGASLPPGAQQPGWWANTPTHHQARSWLRVGWRVQRANVSLRTVTFVRVVAAG